VIASTTAASGRLIKNIHRHEACSTSQPPSTGPTPAEMAVKPDQVPMARPRFSLENDALMMARLPGTSIAAPTPCTARAAMSCPGVCAMPQQAEANAKSRSPAEKTRLLPRRSPRLPPTSISAESISE
jgi:hypothetical protein